MGFNFIPARRATFVSGVLLFLAGLTTNVSADSLAGRRYVILPQALEVRWHEASARRNLVVNWTLSEERTPAVDEIRVQGGGVFSGKTCHLEVRGDTFTGEIRLPRTKDWEAAICRFQGSLSEEAEEGSYAIDQAGRNREGVARLMRVYDAGYSERAIRAWVPPGRAAIRGVFLWGNGGTNDDRYEVVRDHWRAFCRLHRMALVAMSGFDSDMAGASGKKLREQLAEVGRQSGHAELEQAPILFTGHSNGGMKAWDFNALFPERTIAFTVSKAANGNMRGTSAAARNNPALFVIGEADGTGSNQDCYRIFHEGRRQGAPWAFAVEADAEHKLGRLPHFWLPFFEWAVVARLNEGQNETASRPLHPVDPMKGWVVATHPLKQGERLFGPMAEMLSDKGETQWLPNRTLVLAYFGVTAHGAPAQLQMEDDRETFVPGELMHLSLVSSRSIENAEIVINGQPFATVSSKNKVIEFAAGIPGVYSAVAIVRLEGATAISYPLSWVVEPR